MVETYWLVTKEDRSMIRKEHIKVCSSVIEVKKI